MLNVVSLLHATDLESGDRPPSIPRVSLTHDERHLRRRTITLDGSRKALVDFPEAVVLQSGDVLKLDDESYVEIAAAPEPLYEIVSSADVELVELAWHIGNRHLPAAFETNRILVPRDRVIKEMLERLGATVEDVVTSFNPVRSAHAVPHHERHSGEQRHDHHDHAHRRN